MKTTQIVKIIFFNLIHYILRWCLMNIVPEIVKAIIIGDDTN